MDKNLVSSLGTPMHSVPEGESRYLNQAFQVADLGEELFVKLLSFIAVCIGDGPYGVGDELVQTFHDEFPQLEEPQSVDRHVPFGHRGVGQINTVRIVESHF